MAWPLRTQTVAVSLALLVSQMLVAGAAMAVLRRPPSAGILFYALLAAASLPALALAAWALRWLLRRLSQGDRASISLAHILSFMDSTSEAAYGIDLEGRCNFCNRACLRLLGYDAASQLLGRDMHSLVFAPTGGESPTAAALREGRNLHLPEVLAQRCEGAPVLVELWSRLVREGGQVVGAAVTMTDITLPKAAQAEAKREQLSLEGQVRDLSRLSEEIALFGQLTEMLQACATTLELSKVVAYFSKELFPRDCGALYVFDPATQTMASLASWGDEPGKAVFLAQDCWAVRRGKPHYREEPQEDVFCAHLSLPLPAFSFCLPLAGQEGTLGLLHIHSRAGGARLSEARRLVAIALAYQVALGLTNLRLKEILREDAIRDPVTGLFNRRYMKESLDHEIRRAQRLGTGLGLVAFDLDHFKGVNDSLGHAAGDAMLLGLARLAKDGLRAEDISCRQGGDEFLLILPDISEMDALDLAESLRLKAAQYSREQFPALARPVTISAGVAMYPQDGGNAESLQRAADQALYLAKSQGRDRVLAAGAPGGAGDQRNFTRRPAMPRPLKQPTSAPGEMPPSPAEAVARPADSAGSDRRELPYDGDRSFLGRRKDDDTGGEA